MQHEFKLEPVHYASLFNMMNYTRRTSDVERVINVFPEVLRNFEITTRNPRTVEILLSRGYVLPEVYIFRVCNDEDVEILELLCKYGIFNDMLAKGVDISTYAAKPKVGKILYERGLLSREDYNGFRQVWFFLGMKV